MILLALDTAAPRLQLALLRADGTTDCLIEAIERGHAEILFDRTAKLLERNGLAYADLQRVAVTTGPGSFTGVRIGLSAARGLGLALAIPVIGVPSLLAISLGGPKGAPFSVVLDARRDEEYSQSFSAPGVSSGAAQLDRKGIVEGAGQPIISNPFVPMDEFARFAAGVSPSDFPPDAFYLRGADAKPQAKGRVALAGSPS